LKSALLSTLLLLQLANAQSNVWQSVGPSPTPSQDRDVELSEAHQSLIKTTLKKNDHAWECASEDPANKWVEGLRFSGISLSETHRTILVEAGRGCARGGQGANGAMWIVQLEAGKVTVLASPEHRFNGWLYAVQPSSSKGYKDIVLGWHVSAREAGLSYFRFNGTRYDLLSGAGIKWDDSGHATITPLAKAAPQ
jgi:hypothetical protein